MGNSSGVLLKIASFNNIFVFISFCNILFSSADWVKDNKGNRVCGPGVEFVPNEDKIYKVQNYNFKKPHWRNLVYP